MIGLVVVVAGLLLSIIFVFDPYDPHVTTHVPKTQTQNDSSQADSKIQGMSNLAIQGTSSKLSTRPASAKQVQRNKW